MKNAFTIIELLISISIIALLFLGSYNLYLYNFKAFDKAEELNKAIDLAADMKEEILSKPLKNSVKININSIINRIHFNSVFDYDNYSAAPPTDILGNSLENYYDYSVKIKVKNVAPDKYDNIINTTADSGYVSVAISIFKNKEQLIELPFIMTE